MYNLLFTSVGRRVELLRLFRKSHTSLGLHGRIIALDQDPLASALHVADRFYVVPGVTAPDYMPTVVEVCRREQVHLVFPLIDPDIPVLAANREALEEVGARVAVVGREAVAISGDKWQSMEFFNELQLPVPNSWLPGTRDSAALEYPVFIKPRFGSAGKWTFAARNPDELAFFASYVPKPIIQEFLPGPEITSDVICDLDGEVLAIISRERIEVRWGEVAKGTTVFDARITDACSTIARALPAVGPITVQCMMKDGIPHFTEINARLGGGAPLGVAAGADWPSWLLGRCAGLPVHPPTLGSYETGVYMTRFDEAFYRSTRDVQDTARHRL